MAWFGRSSKSVCIAVGISSILLGCRGPETPYALKLGDVDEEGPQTAAAITISDPKVFARETLINDRRLEVAYLQNVLDDSRYAEFEPSISRNLKSFQALQFTGAVKADPAAGVAARRQDDVNQLAHQMQMLRLRADLAEYERQLNEAQAGSRRETNFDLDTDGEGNKSTNPSDDVSGTEIDRSADGFFAGRANPDTVRGELKAALDLSNSASTTNVKRAGGNGLSPIEDFRERQSYRAEIRSALASVNLDDLHDYGGNALYRLQFSAFVAPGSQKNKYGAADLEVVAPEIPKRDLSRLYFSWLTYVLEDLNERSLLVLKANIDKDLRETKLKLRKGQPLEIKRDPDAESNPFLQGYVPLDQVANQQAGHIASDAATTALNEIPKVNNELGRTRPEFKGNSEIISAFELEGYYGRKRIRLRPKETCLRDTNDAATANIVDCPGEFQPEIALPPGEATDRVVEVFLSNPRPGDRFSDRNVPEKIQKFKRINLSLTGRVRKLAEAGGKTTPDDDSKFWSCEIRFEKNSEKLREQRTWIERYVNLLKLMPGIRFFSDRYNQWIRRHYPNEGDQLLVRERWFSYFGTPETGGKTESVTLFEVIDTLERLSKDYISTYLPYTNDPKRCARILEIDPESYLPYGALPAAFMQGVVKSCSAATDKCKLKGDTYGYGTTPSQLSQRGSTIASSAKSLEVALAAAGSFAQAGIGAEASLGYLRSAAGNVEALESVPLVVGYSNRRGNDDYRNKNDEVETAPSFGWVFGPSMRLDPKNDQIVLEQRVRSYEVTADISVPGWWPKVDIKQNSAWVANWHQGLDLIDLNNSKRRETKLSVPLPRNETVLNDLSLFLIDNLELSLPGFNEPEIAEISPKRVSSCASEITFLIFGRNIWRSTEVYLGGKKIPAESISVLPDMKGVSATIPIGGLFSNGRRGGRYLREDVLLTVATRTGTAKKEVSVVSPKSGSCAAAQALDVVGNRFTQSEFDVKPRSINSCDSSPIIFLEETTPNSKAFSIFGEAQTRTVADIDGRTKMGAAGFSYYDSLLASDAKTPGSIGAQASNAEGGFRKVHLNQLKGDIRLGSMSPDDVSIINGTGTRIARLTFKGPVTTAFGPTIPLILASQDSVVQEPVGIVPCNNVTAQSSQVVGDFTVYNDWFQVGQPKQVKVKLGNERFPVDEASLTFAFRAKSFKDKLGWFHEVDPDYNASDRTLVTEVTIPATKVSQLGNGELLELALVVTVGSGESETKKYYVAESQPMVLYLKPEDLKVVRSKPADTDKFSEVVTFKMPEKAHIAFPDLYAKPVLLKIAIDRDIGVELVEKQISIESQATAFKHKVEFTGSLTPDKKKELRSQNTTLTFSFKGVNDGLELPTIRDNTLIIKKAETKDEEGG